MVSGTRPSCKYIGAGAVKRAILQTFCRLLSINLLNIGEKIGSLYLFWGGDWSSRMNLK